MTSFHYARNPLRIAYALTCSVSVIIALGLAGCGAPRDDFRTLKLALDENPTTLDPAYIIDVSGGSVAAKLYNGLVAVDQKLALKGDLAERYEVSPDGRVYTFFLKRGVRFHNGRELTAEDVRYSFTRVLDPATVSTRTWVLDKIMGAEAFLQGKADRVSGIACPDGMTVQITLERPCASFLWLLTMPNAYVVPREEVEKWGKDFARHAVGTGPYRLGEWRQDYRLLLERFDGYFEGAPRMERIEYRIIPDQFTAFTEFERGNLDIVGVPASEFRRITVDPARAAYIHSNVGMNTYYIGFNCTRSPFDKPAVRRAFNYMIDRAKMVDKLLDGRAIAAVSALPPGLPGSELPAEGYRYDPQLAGALLKEAGVPDGFECTLYQNKTKEASHIIEAIHYYLRQAGVRVRIVEREWSSYKEALIKGEADLFFLSWWADYPDAENFFFPNFFSGNAGAGGNKTFFKDARIDAMIEAANGVAGEKERAGMYAAINEEIFAQAPWVFLWHRKEFVITQPWVKGYFLYPIYNADKGTDVSIDLSKTSGR